jgi:hypothetical protein
MLSVASIALNTGLLSEDYRVLRKGARNESTPEMALTFDAVCTIVSVCLSLLISNVL